jgi:hypothetical protein
MKKLSLLFLSSIIAISSFSQVKVGLRIAPSLCMNRVKDLNSNDAFSYSNNSSGVRFAFGPTIDIKMGQNFAFATGAWYMSSRAGLTASNAFGKYTEVVSLQTIQLPITFKAYTNEIATNMKIYFQLGGMANIIFNEKYVKSDPSGSASNYTKKYSFFDFSIYMGTGVTYKIGNSNELFAGVYYNRGLLNLLMNKSDGLGGHYNKDAQYNMDQAGLEVGMRF